MPEFLSPAEAAAYLRVSDALLKKMRSDGNGPAFIRVGERRVVYDRKAIAEWALNRTRTIATDDALVAA